MWQNGQGAATFDDGRKYVGGYRDDMMHGQGSLTFASGSNYVGEFKDDNLHGKGIYTYADGRKSKEVIFENGQLIN